MNKTIVLFVLIAGIYSCGSNKQNNSNTGIASAMRKSSSGLQIISVEAALTYISNFIVHYEMVSKHVAIGGGYTSKVLVAAGVPNLDHDVNKIAGTMFMEGNNHSFTPNWLKLYVRQIPNYDTTSTNEYVPANSDCFFKPDSMFVYKDTLPDTAAVRSFLVEQVLNMTSHSDSLAYEHIKEYCDSFLTAFTVNQFPYAFFNSSEVDDLINQKDSRGNLVSVGMSYYFGYDNSAPINKIRIILIAVDSNGKNILTIDGQPALLKEHSWPPIGL